MSLLTLLYDHPGLALLGVGLAVPTVGVVLETLVQGVLACGQTFLGWLVPPYEFQDEYTSGVVLSYLLREARSFGLGEQRVEATHTWVRSADQERVVMERRVSRSFHLFLFHGVPIVLLPMTVSSTGVVHQGRLLALRGTVAWDDLLTRAARSHDEYLDGRVASTRYCVQHLAGNASSFNNSTPDGISPAPKGGDQVEPDSVYVNYPREDVGAPLPEKPLGNLALGEEAQLVIRAVRFWHAHRTWYRGRGVPWRFGVLLYGQPGTGKTSLVRALAQLLDLPLYVFHLGSMDDQEFVRYWKVASHDAPRLVLFEDLDTVFDGRQNVSEGGLSFTTVLNAIDGVEQQDGLLLCVTTNRVGCIDEALGRPHADDPHRSTRPGRIDLCAQLPPLDAAGRRQVALRILQDPDEVEAVVTAGKGDAAVQFVDRCRLRAVELLMDESKEEVA